jgi:hypothetical protein
MKIYETKVGKSFAENDLDEGILANKILLFYLNAHSLHPKDFKLNFFEKSDRQEYFEAQIHQNILKALNQKQPSFLTDDNGRILPKVVLNSISNGFLVERAGIYQINIKFALERYFTIGEIISGFTFLVVILLLIFIHRRENRH